MSHHKRWAAPLLLLVGCLLLLNVSASAQGTTRLYLPLVSRVPNASLFGFESGPSRIVSPAITTQAQSLGAHWVRLYGVQWSQVEPARGAGYNWSILAQFEQAVIRAKALGLNPTVIVNSPPAWSTETGASCGAVRDEYLVDFANFMAALTQRYKDQVTYWEIGNEPDVDPRLLIASSPYGCWGNIDDPYYGGERYGRMLQVIAPAMRAANPHVKIVLGGLLLDRPETTNPAFGRPELFLEGILRAGAASSFDIVAYHAYPSYTDNPAYDHDLYDLGNLWTAWGGWTLGKAAFLRDIMARYGVSKPLWLNETGLICRVNPAQQCISAVDDSFRNAQANHLVRLASRAGAAGIQQVIWYTLDGPGWREAGLLDSTQSTRPAYRAYQRMISLVSGYSSVSAVADYGAEIEAYRFVKPGGVVDVAWSRSANPAVAQLPASAFRAATIWNGATPSTSQSGAQKLVLVGFDAVFIERAP